MHIFLYEWATGGGLVDQPGRLPPSMLAEGAAMISALAADFAALPGVRISTLRDMRIDEPLLNRCEPVEIDSASAWREEFDRLVAAADRTLVVAPEFDGILRRTLRRVVDAGGASLNADDSFVALTTDKHRTATLLREQGVLAPEGRVLEAEQPRLPADFTYPAVLKPLDGAGSQDMHLVMAPGDQPPAYPWARRLERYCPGRAASIAALCGPGGAQLLSPCWQRLSEDGRFSYRGGATIAEASLVQRAESLGRRALAALGPARGFVGIDVVLGADPGGRDDVVIEVNPRLTTSYLGLRAAFHENLAQAILDVDEGRECILTRRPQEVAFSADGAVWNV